MKNPDEVMDMMAEALVAARRKGIKWHPCDAVVVLINEAIAHYRSYKNGKSDE